MNNTSKTKKLTLTCKEELTSNSIIKKSGINEKQESHSLLKNINNVLKSRKHSNDGFYEYKFARDDGLCQFFKNSNCGIDDDIHELCPSNVIYRSDRCHLGNSFTSGREFFLDPRISPPDVNFQPNNPGPSFFNPYFWRQEYLIGYGTGALVIMVPVFYFIIKKLCTSCNNLWRWLKQDKQNSRITSREIAKNNQGLTDGDSMDNDTKELGNIVQRSNEVQGKTSLENSVTGNNFQMVDRDSKASTCGNRDSQESFEYLGTPESASVHNGGFVPQHQPDPVGSSKHAVVSQNRSEGAAPTPTSSAAASVTASQQPLVPESAPDIAGLTQTLSAESSTPAGTSSPATGYSYANVDRPRVKEMLSRYLK